LVQELPAAEYEVMLRRRRTASQLFSSENVDLQRTEAELQTQQQSLMGGIRVEFAGETRTLQQLAPFLQDQDRDVREQAFRTGLAARQRHWAELEGIYDRLVELRTRIARNAGFHTYTPYRFLELGRYDYDERTCRQIQDAIAEHVVPAVHQLDRQRAARLGLARLRPWDLDVDEQGRPPLRPFQTQPQLVGLCRRLVAAVDPEFGTWLDELDRRDLLDLMSRTDKTPGGYQYQIDDDRVPFVFANSVGLHADLQTLLHESGHAMHSLLCRHYDLDSQRDYPIEIAETASMSMELMGLEHLDLVYPPESARTVYKKHLQGVLRTLTWIASIDAFQHWVHGQPAHDRDERRTAWLDIWRRFGDSVDWTDLGDARAMAWIRQSHLFTHPFYYIEYAIAQLAALQVWQQYRRDRKRAVANYRRALALGGSRPLPELFAAMEVQFDLSAPKLRELVDDVMAQMAN
jgi:oligoendopeptidase F